MSTVKRKAKVVMLPTNEKAGTIWKTTNGQLIHTHVSGEYKEKYTPQHLYITSDDEIKEGDWCIDSNGSIYQHKKGKSFTHYFQGKKIIATTDSSLRVSKFSHYSQDLMKVAVYKDYILPQPSQQFIEKYIEEYNKGQQITDILVEYANDKEYWAARNQFNPSSIDFKVYTLEDKEEYLGVMFDYHPVKLNI